jgi:hypothetical protein
VNSRLSCSCFVFAGVGSCSLSLGSSARPPGRSGPGSGARTRPPTRWSCVRSSRFRPDREISRTLSDCGVRERLDLRDHVRHPLGARGRGLSRDPRGVRERETAAADRPGGQPTRRLSHPRTNCGDNSSGFIWKALGRRRSRWPGRTWRIRIAGFGSRRAWRSNGSPIDTGRPGHCRKRDRWR